MTIIAQPVNDLLRTVARAADITASYGHARTKPEQIDGLTRAMLSVAHVQQELESFARFVYMRDPSNRRWLHLLPDGTLAPGVHTPWRGPSSTLTRNQQDKMRAWWRLKLESRLRPPLRWDHGIKRWSVDLVRYPTLDGALAWLDAHRITATEWINLPP